MDKHKFLESSPHRWLLFLSGTLYFFFEFLQLNLLNSISTSLLQSFSTSSRELGYFSIIYLVALISMFIPSGILLDRVSTRKAMLTACAISIAGTLLFAFSPNLFVAGIGRALVGCTHAIAFLGSVRLASRWLSSKIALAIGFISAFGVLGGIVSQLPIAFFTVHLGWRSAVCINAGIGVLVWIMMYFFVKDKPESITNIPAKQKSSLSDSWNDFKKNYTNWLSSFYSAILNLPVLVLGALWSNIYLVNDLHFRQLQASVISTMIYFGMLVGGPTIGWFSDKIQNRRSPMITLTLIAFIIMLSILFTRSNSVIIFSILFFALGVTASGQVLGYSIITENSPKSSTSFATGIASIIIMGTSIVFQPLVGYIINHYKNALIGYEDALSVLLVAFMLNIAISFFIKEHHKLSNNNR